ncbi:spherical body protein, putative [Babesia ovis]|uniref:Spherical body protein, putative n=1 Tax=Babesia ovis TaxID=5869 RepID=A0A9W5TF03_BABOV|nr:spherical body protein, putative [Babesia ovis]
MRQCMILALLAASAAATIIDPSNENYPHDLDDNYMPLFTENQLKNPVIAPLDIASGHDEDKYNAKTYVTKCGKIMSTIFHAPSDSLFQTITCGEATIFEPHSFLAYKVVVDYINTEANYVRIYGIVRRGVYGVRYLINTPEGFVKVSRADYLRHRAQYSTTYTFDLLADNSTLMEHNIVVQNPESPQQLVTYYPKFNHRVGEIVAGSVKLCSFDQSKLDTGMKIMTYVYEGKKHCLIRVMSFEGVMEEYLFVESDAGGFTRVSQEPSDSSHGKVQSGAGAEQSGNGNKVEEVEEEKVINYVQIAPTSYGGQQTFASVEFLKVNCRRLPREDGHWFGTTAVNNFGTTERTFIANDGYVIYRFTDDDRLIWERPGYGITHASLFTNSYGVEYVQLAVLNEDGAIFEYYFDKRGDEWFPTPLDDLPRLSNPDKVGTIEQRIKLMPRELPKYALEQLRRTIPVQFDTELDLHYSWMTDRVSEGKLIHRKYCTAMENYYSFRSFVHGENEVIADLKDQYRSTQALHYNILGLELLAFNAYDLRTGNCTIHYFMRRDGRWTRIDEFVFYQRINDIMTFIITKKRQEKQHGYAVDKAFDDQVAMYVLQAMNTYRDRNVDAGAPVRYEYDSHTGGYNLGANPHHERECSGRTECSCPCKCKCVCAAKKAVQLSNLSDITLELKHSHDERYNIHAVTSRDDTVRISFKPADGYRFVEVTEDNMPVFERSHYYITDALIDQATDGQFFMQLTAYDTKDGDQHIYYYYKAEKSHAFNEIGRPTYIALRYKSMTKVSVDISKKNNGNNLLRFDSRHYKDVYAFVPRYNCVIDSVYHGRSNIWRFDELNPEVVTRVVTFTRDNIRGVLLQLVDANAKDVDRLYLNTNPNTNEYAPFLHKGDMFALFKQYLLNRSSGKAGFKEYRANDIDWTKEIKKDSWDYRRIHSKKYIAPSAYDSSARIQELSEEKDCCSKHANTCSKKQWVCKHCKATKPERVRTETPKEMERRLEREATAAHKQNIKDHSYYTSLPLTLKDVIHKEGVVWDSKETGEVCLDLKKYKKGQYRLVECEIMTPDGRVEIRYFMNTHNGRGAYKEVELCKIGMDL